MSNFVYICTWNTSHSQPNACDHRMASMYLDTTRMHLSACRACSPYFHFGFTFFRGDMNRFVHRSAIRHLHGWYSRSVYHAPNAPLRVMSISKTNKAAGWLRGGWHARRTWTKWHAFILSLLQCYMLHWSRCNNDKSPHNSARLLGRIAIDDIFNRIDLNLFMGFFSHYNTLYCYYLWWDMIWCKTCEHQHKSFIEIYWSRKYRIYECLLVQTSWWTHK